MMRCVSERRRSLLISAAGLLGIAALTAGCSSSSPVFSSSDQPQSESQRSFSDRFAQLLGGNVSPPATTGATTPADDKPDTCPPVDVRQGASTLSVTGAPARGATDPSAMQLRYQGNLGQTARECLYSGGNLVIRVGVQGRIILGPEGTPGEVDVPLRYALIREGPQPKTIWTKLYRFPVVIGEGQSGAPFTHVEEDMIVPKPTASDLNAYVIYIGFDTIAAPPKSKPVQKKR